MNLQGGRGTWNGLEGGDDVILYFFFVTFLSDVIIF